MSVTLIEGQKMKVQGKKQEVFKRYKGWRIMSLGNGNGNWLVTKKCEVMVDGRERSDEVRKLYNREKITSNLIENLKEDMESGKVKFAFSYKHIIS